MWGQVHGADVTVFRIQDPIKGDDPKQYEEGVLEAPIVTIPVSSCVESNCVLPLSTVLSSYGEHAC